MMIQDNVTPLPGKNERIVRKIKAGLARIEKGDREWVEGQIEVAEGVAEKRAELNDTDFGAWFDSEFPEINDQDRAAYAAMGQDPAKLRAVLEKTKRKSIRLIYKIEWMFDSAVKRRLKSVKTDRAREVVREAIETGAPLNQHRLADEAGVSTAPIKFALHYERGREEGIAWARANPEIDTGALPKTAKDKLDIAIRQERRRLEAEYERKRMAEVEAHIKKIAPQLKEEQIEAGRLQLQYQKMIAEKAIFTADEFKLILMCLHPDNGASAERRAEAFRLVNARKLQLTGAT